MLHTTWLCITPSITHDDVHYPAQGLEMHGYLNKLPISTLHIANRDGEFYRPEEHYEHELACECIESL